ncbi:MAG: NAD-dependent epimerase/dehydratase family protein, partial [Actinobacteria bacterium]|nr:NAD-dependent epimerase/dehydratase family protein [Actinomycetota bacterium]
MKLFITGAAGFIGSNYVRHVLSTTDDEVTVFDALTYAGNLSSLDDVANDPRFRFVQGDICDRAAVAAAMDGHDAVVHFAAESHVDRSIVDPDTFVRTNCLGTNVMCDVARNVGVDRFLHISTDEVYGSIDDGSFVETDRLGPRSPYSSSKAGSDLIALSYEETYGLPVIVTRSSNNFGPYQFPEKVIPLFVTNLLDG